MNLEFISQAMHLGLEWIGFGTLVGLVAKAVMPGRDGGGALATVILGILGSLIGAALLAFFIEEFRVTPISVLGFIVALGGASVLLFVYRILGGGAGIRPWFGALHRRPYRPYRRRGGKIIDDVV